MSLSLKETRAITGMTDVLYDFLPGTGHSVWKGHVNFATVAAQVGVGDYWHGGSKKPAINTLLSQTLQHKRGLFEQLMVEIVRASIAYREKQNQPITATEIDDLNGHILEVGFKFPELWDKGFRNSLQQTNKERARQHVADENSRDKQQSKEQLRSLELAKFKEWFFSLASDADRNRAGLALEKLLNQLFFLFDLEPREPFRVVGEQIDGSFVLDNEVYLLECKWEKEPLPEAPLLVFRGKIEGKSTFTRGVFIALNDISAPARDAITRGKAPSFFIMNGHDLLMILSEAMDLRTFLRKRVRLLAEEGRLCVPFHSLQ